MEPSDDGAIPGLDIGGTQLQRLLRGLAGALPTLFRHQPSGGRGPGLVQRRIVLARGLVFSDGVVAATGFLAGNAERIPEARMVPLQVGRLDQRGVRLGVAARFNPRLRGADQLLDLLVLFGRHGTAPFRLKRRVYAQGKGWRARTPLRSERGS